MAKITDDHLERIGEIVGMFMLRNGGFANGHCTSAHGDVRLNDHGTLTLTFPYAASKDMRVSQLRDLGTNLYEKIHHYLDKHEIDHDVTIKIRSKPTDEHGSREISVMYTKEHAVKLWRLADKILAQGELSDKAYKS